MTSLLSGLKEARRLAQFAKEIIDAALAGVDFDADEIEDAAIRYGLVDLAEDELDGYEFTISIETFDRAISEAEAREAVRG